MGDGSRGEGVAEGASAINFALWAFEVVASHVRPTVPIGSG